MRKKALNITILVCIIGIIVASISTKQHIRILKEGLINESYCTISHYINCDAINASSYSEFLKVPIAWWGVLFYFSMLLFSIYAKSSRKGQSTIAFSFFASILSIIYSLFLAYIAYFVIKAFCLECTIMYIVNIIIAITLYQALHFKEGILTLTKRYIRDILVPRAPLLPFKHQLISHLAIMALIFAGGYLPMYKFLTNIAPYKFKTDISKHLERYNTSSIYDIDPLPHSLVWGNPKGEVEIIEISCYQCPWCQKAAFMVRPALRELKDHIRYYFINYPLSNECNPTIKTNMHPQSCLSAKAGICASEFGIFWQLHDWMFRNQRNVSTHSILKEVKKLGIEPKAFKACIESNETYNLLQDDIAKANHISVPGVPFFLINKKHIKEWRNVDLIRKIIRMEIKAAKAGSS